MTQQELFALRPGQQVVGPNDELLNVTSNTGTYIALERPDSRGGINLPIDTSHTKWWAGEAQHVPE